MIKEIKLERSKKSKHISFTCCDRCSIGSGVTKYPDGDFEHEQKTLNKRNGKELCDDCVAELERKKHGKYHS